MKILIDGNIPQSAGLSSSSALVVCSALTTAICSGIHINKVDFRLCFFSRRIFAIVFRVISQNSVLNVRSTLVHKEVHSIDEFLRYSSR